MEETSHELQAAELDELQARDAQLDKQLAAGCELLLSEFSRRYPPLKRVPELVLRPETLRKWLSDQPERQP